MFPYPGQSPHATDVHGVREESRMRARVPATGRAVTHRLPLDEYEAEQVDVLEDGVRSAVGASVRPEISHARQELSSSSSLS